ncbi:MAG: formate/nitrite transporter family protein [Thermoleophilia bacterium]|nr:formate/nitrite transporter family protein [Thermoleophilia bacterium]
MNRIPGQGTKSTQKFGIDAYSPQEISARVEETGTTKAHLPLVQLISLAVLAGGFIGLGSIFYIQVASDPALDLAVGRVLGGVVFSLGLILVIVAGAELFTGSNLIVMAWVSRKISTGALLRNWSIVYAGNFIGAAGLALLLFLSRQWEMADGAVGVTGVSIAATKASLPFGELFFKGVLCNILVCLAVWLCYAGRSVIDKIGAIIFPISAFVAAGFEHSVANMYFLSSGLILKSRVSADIPNLENLDIAGVIQNLIPVTLGNIFGGGVMVALVYYMVYLRKR